MSQGIKCYAVIVRAFVICDDLDGKELPPNEWPVKNLLEELDSIPPGKVSVRAVVIDEFACDKQFQDLWNDE